MVTQGDVYEMSSPPGNIDHYFDCGIGSDLTPTVVSNFKAPNSGINKDGPYLEIVEQPQTKFRFRYKSEMVGTHGQLKAESSGKNKNIFPTVKLCNWNGGPALIRLMLYTAEENANERKRHVHELSGKNCNKDGFTGGCEVVADEKNNYTAQFPNLGIIHIAKRDVQNIIYQRKKEELITRACIRNPTLRTESIQHNISPTDLQKLKESAEDEAKTMDLNKVVLRFQAYFFNTKTDCYRPITENNDSDVIFNLKNASTGELKIVRISAVSAPCSGGTEVWMLVEKVKKSNVRIKFFELDVDNCEVWRGYGEFKESEVHHQYAIVFRTPPYQNTNIRESVQVKIQLERPSDNDTSESIDFTYIPETLKRRSAFLENKADLDLQPMKRVRHSDTEALDLIKKNENLFLGAGETKQPFSPETPYQSPAHMVPSPIAPEASPAPQGFYSPQHYGGISSVCSADDSQGLSSNLEYRHQHLVVEGVQQPVGSPTFQFTLVGSQNAFVGNNTETGIPSPPYQQGGTGSSIPSPIQNRSSPYHQVPSPSYSQHSPNHQSFGTSPAGYNLLSVYGDHQSEMLQNPETALHQIQQFDAVQKEVMHNKTHIMFDNYNLDFKDLVCNPNPLHQNEDVDLLDMLGDKKMFYISKGYGDIQADSASVKDKTKKKSSGSAEKKDASHDVDVLTRQLASFSVHEKSKEKDRAESKLKDIIGSPQVSEKDLAFRVAVKAAECLQIYAASGNISLLLATHRYLLGVQNTQGDNSLHTAVSNKNLEAFNKIIGAAHEVFCSDLLNTQNYAGETPLHLAVREGQLRMIERLLKSPGCKLDIVDCDGNTPVHLAASQHLPLSVILPQAVNGMHQDLAKVINAYNYHGKTPLHLAVTEGSLNSVKLLLKAGAQVHLCERKRGANPLHLAASFNHHNIAKYLIKNTDVTLDAGMFDGNTALHIAAVANDKLMCSILMNAKANPFATNSLSKHRKTSESELDDEEQGKEEEERDEDSEDEFFTVFDYAADNEEILAVLNGKYVPESDKELMEEKQDKVEDSKSNPLDSGIGISVTDLQERSND